MKKTYALVDVLGNVYTTGRDKFTEDEIKEIEKKAGKGLYQKEFEYKK